MGGWIVVMDRPNSAAWLATQGTQSMASQGELQQLGCDGPAHGAPYQPAGRLNEQPGRHLLVPSFWSVVDGWQPIIPGLSETCWT